MGDLRPIVDSVTALKRIGRRRRGLLLAASRQLDSSAIWPYSTPSCLRAVEKQTLSDRAERHKQTFRQPTDEATNNRLPNIS
jgi:hypothetical protein